MTTTADDLPNDIAALRAALIAERARAAKVEAELAVAKAKASDDQALIAHQRLQIAKLTRQLYGQHSERTVRLLDQIELAFEELESSASEDEVAAEQAVARTTNVVAFTRKRPAREYLATLDQAAAVGAAEAEDAENDMPPGNSPATPKVTSLTDPTAAWTNGKHAVSTAGWAIWRI